MHRRKVILASASPRRRQFLDALGIPHTVIPAHVDETPYPDETPEQMVARLAQIKARTVADQLPQDWWPAVVIAADTTVALEGQILGKPESPEEALAMLRTLRGRPHQVHSGLALVGLEIDGARHEAVRVHTAQVWMRAYDDAEIQAYVASGDPLDKAGSYALQNPDFRPVARLEGCAAAVMGFPLADFVAMAPDFGLPLPPQVTPICQQLTGLPCCLDAAE